MPSQLLRLYQGDYQGKTRFKKIFNKYKMPENHDEKQGDSNVNNSPYLTI